MEFEFKDKAYAFPMMLSEITLEQRIGFYQTYGKDLDTWADEIQGMNSGFEKDVAVSEWHLANAVRTFSHYTGIPLEEVQAEINLADIMNIYNTDMQLLMEQEQSIQVQREYMWNEEKWILAAPELRADSAMVFNQFLVGKEITRLLHDMGMGKWDALPYLCCVYLLKDGEEFDESFTLPDAARMKAIMQLPLDIALAVGFFLSSTLSIYSSTLAYSSQAKQKESTPASTLTGGDG